jgi:hypothetical protein
MWAEHDSAPVLWKSVQTPEMRRAAILEPRLSTGVGGRSPIFPAGWWTDHPSAGAGARMRQSRPAIARSGR